MILNYKKLDIKTKDKKLKKRGPATIFGIPWYFAIPLIPIICLAELAKGRK